MWGNEMNNDITTRLMKIFAIGLTALILAFAAFGAGVGVGARMAGQTTAAVIPSPTPIPAPTRNLETTTAGSVAPTQAPSIVPSSTPSPSPTPRPSATQRPQANSTIPLNNALLQEVWDLLVKQFYGDLPSEKELTYNAIRGIVDRLGDPHTAFVEPKAAALMNEQMQGAFEGIGARVERAEGGGVLISYLFPNQPAEQSGLRVGDVIIAVDGVDITRLDLMEAITRIRGPKGTVVTLTIRRERQPVFDVKVTRARIEIPVVETKSLADGKIAYIALSEFSSIAPTRLADALRDALAQNPRGLILDLRGNPGGLLDAAVRIGSYFVPSGNILIERFKDGTERNYTRQGRYLLGNTPLVVLVDAGSASASEIVAGAIQDAGTGILIGEKTYGKGSVQLPNNLSDGSQLRVTIARWFTPKDRAIHGVGLNPDISVALTAEDRAAKRDPQLDRAVEYLLKGK